MVPHADPGPRDFFEEVRSTKAVEANTELVSQNHRIAPTHKENTLDRIWSNLSHQSRNEPIAAEEREGSGGSHGDGRDTKTIVSFVQDDLENPYNWSSVGVHLSDEIPGSGTKGVYL